MGGVGGGKKRGVEFQQWTEEEEEEEAFSHELLGLKMQAHSLSGC